MNVVHNHAVQHCNRGTAGDGIGIGTSDRGCLMKRQHLKEDGQSSTSTRIKQTTSRPAASGSNSVNLILSSRPTSSTLRAIPPPASSIISLFSSATVGTPLPTNQTSITSKSKSNSTPTQISTPSRTSQTPPPPTDSTPTILSLSPSTSNTPLFLNAPTSFDPIPVSSPTTIPTQQFQTSLSITNPYPSSLAPFFPSAAKPTSLGNNNTNPNVNVSANISEGLSPEEVSAKQSSMEAGILSGIIVGVLVMAAVLVMFIFTRYRKREYGRKSGSVRNWYGKGGDDEKFPILGLTPYSWDSASFSEKGSRSLRTKNKSYSRKASPTMGMKDDLGVELGIKGPGNNYNPSQTQSQSQTQQQRPLTLSVPAPAFLRANRSSSVYSGSILNALAPLTPKLDAKPEIPLRNPRRGLSLNLGFGSGSTGKDKEDLVKRSKSVGGNELLGESTQKWEMEGKDRIWVGHMWKEIEKQWQGDKEGEKEQWPRTIEDFQRARNLGDNMRRGRTDYEVGSPYQGEGEDGDEGLSEEVRVYREAEEETGVLKENGLELGREKSTIAKDRRGRWKDSGIGTEAWFGSDVHENENQIERRDSGKSMGRDSVKRPYSESGYGGLGYGGGGEIAKGSYAPVPSSVKRKTIVNIDTVSIFSQEEERERFEALKRAYKGRIKFGMGVQKVGGGGGLGGGGELGGEFGLGWVGGEGGVGGAEGGGMGGPYEKDVVVNIDTVSIFSEDTEAEKYEALKRSYTGRIKWGMGVQRRYSREWV